MQLPTPRGTTSSRLVAALGRPFSSEQPLDDLRDAARDTAQSPDPLRDEDLQLSLWVLYELHYRGFEDVDDRWEWHPGLVEARLALEEVFEADLRRRTAATVAAALARPRDVAEQLFGLVDAFEGPSTARYVHREATVDQVREMLVHRSIYQLKEADPHTWAVPRLDGPPKVALVELQYDEYGAGRPARQHARLFAEGMASVGLDARYGAYLDAVPACTLALSNAMSLLGLHRRLRGAAVGHLAALEATSSLPCKKYVGGLTRLGLPAELIEYFDEHVEADAVHEQVAARDICGGLVKQEPSLLEDVLFGAAVCLVTDAALSEHLLGCWREGRGSLRDGRSIDVPAEAVA